LRLFIYRVVYNYCLLFPCRFGGETNNEPAFPSLIVSRAEREDRSLVFLVGTSRFAKHSGKGRGIRKEDGVCSQESVHCSEKERQLVLLQCVGTFTTRSTIIVNVFVFIF